MVKVPVLGGFENVIVPLSSYCCVVLLQAVGAVEIAEMEQLTTQGGGAVKFCVNVQVGSPENTAVTVHPLPVEGIPVSVYGLLVAGKGALMTCVAPLQLLVIVSVPEAGGSE